MQLDAANDLVAQQAAEIDRLAALAQASAAALPPRTFIAAQSMCELRHRGLGARPRGHSW